MKWLNDSFKIIAKIAAHVTFFLLCWAAGLLVSSLILLLVYCISLQVTDSVTWISLCKGVTVLSLVLAFSAFIATELKIALFNENEE